MRAALNIVTLTILVTRYVKTGNSRMVMIGVIVISVAILLYIGVLKMIPGFNNF